MNLSLSSTMILMSLSKSSIFFLAASSSLFFSSSFLTNYDMKMENLLVRTEYRPIHVSEDAPGRLLGGLLLRLILVSLQLVVVLDSQARDGVSQLLPRDVPVLTKD